MTALETQSLSQRRLVFGAEISGAILIRPGGFSLFLLLRLPSTSTSVSLESVAHSERGACGHGAVKLYE